MIVVVNDCTSIECLELNSVMIVIEILILISTHYHSIIISYDVETFTFYVNGALFMRNNKIKAHTKQGLVLTCINFQKTNISETKRRLYKTDICINNSHSFNTSVPWPNG